jgi:hypothetical protein
MELVAELHEHIQASLDGRMSLSELEGLLSDVAITIDQAGHEEARQLAARIWRLISEYGAGHRDEDSLHLEFRSLLPNGRVSYSG